MKCHLSVTQGRIGFSSEFVTIFLETSSGKMSKGFLASNCAVQLCLRLKILNECIN